MSGRALAQARRRAMSSAGKGAVTSTDRTKAADEVPPPAAQAAKGGDCGCGCKGEAKAADAGAPAPAEAETLARRPSGARMAARPKIAPSVGRAASLARRRAQSARGKGGEPSSGMTPSQAARSMNPDLTGRELAKALREARSRQGGAGQKKSAPCGRIRPNAAGDGPGAASDQPWKVGAGETSHGQTVTGTQLKRSTSVTGDEASTCRNVTGTEYMDAEVFREFCNVQPTRSFVASGKGATSRGNAVTGSRVNRSEKVTGSEAGAGKPVTGTEYATAGEAGPAKGATGKTEAGKKVTGDLDLRSQRVTGNESGAQRSLTGTQYTQIGSGGAPMKVGTSKTLRGGAVTGTTIGRREKMTGDEAGSCHNVTGGDYYGQEQFASFCGTTPSRTDRKVGLSRTMGGEAVSGTLTGRSARVTGDEPGTCKAVTGTPYAGADQYGEFCDAPRAGAAAARMQRARRNGAMPMTGSQPSVGGAMTGEKGICETVSGTPYVGADQLGAACPATPAEPGSPDFPQPLSEKPWGAFSTPSPGHASRVPARAGGVTGGSSDGGQITGPFGMAAGKVTGTDEARFGKGASAPMTPPPAQIEATRQEDGRVKSRISGEGMDAGPKITGDDWDRGDRVTGTEGASAKQRNPTRRGGPMSAMEPLRINARNDDFPEPVSKVTGSSGNTEKGAMVTYSGGARG